MKAPVLIPALVLAAAPIVARAQTRPAPALAPAATLEGARPLPGPVYEIPGFTRAVERGTRTRNGRPGARYWVQHARYRIEAAFDPGRNRLSGSEEVTYLNESPDTVRRLAVMLRQNAFALGSPRRQPAPITGGVSLSRVAVEGQVVTPGNVPGAVVPITDVATHRPAASGYTLDGTVLSIPLSSPLPPRDSIRLEFAWSFSPPPAPADGRQG